MRPGGGGGRGSLIQLFVRVASEDYYHPPFCTCFLYKSVNSFCLCGRCSSSNLLCSFVRMLSNDCVTWLPLQIIEFFGTCSGAQVEVKLFVLRTQYFNSVNRRSGCTKMKTNGWLDCLGVNGNCSRTEATEDLMYIYLGSPEHLSSK